MFLTCWSPIIEEFWRFLTIGLSDSAKGLQTKEKALISLRAIMHGAGCFALIGLLLALKLRT